MPSWWPWYQGTYLKWYRAHAFNTACTAVRNGADGRGHGQPTFQSRYVCECTQCHVDTWSFWQSMVENCEWESLCSCLFVLFKWIVPTEVQNRHSWCEWRNDNLDLARGRCSIHCPWGEYYERKRWEWVAHTFILRKAQQTCVKPFSRPLRRRVSEDYIECIST